MVVALAGTRQRRSPPHERGVLGETADLIRRRAFSPQANGRVPDPVFFRNPSTCFSWTGRTGPSRTCPSPTPRGPESLPQGRGSDGRCLVLHCGFATSKGLSKENSPTSSPPTPGRPFSNAAVFAGRLTTLLAICRRGLHPPAPPTRRSAWTRVTFLLLVQKKSHQKKNDTRAPGFWSFDGGPTTRGPQRPIGMRRHSRLIPSPFSNGRAKRVPTRHTAPLRQVGPTRSAKSPKTNPAYGAQNQNHNRDSFVSLCRKQQAHVG